MLFHADTWTHQTSYFKKKPKKPMSNRKEEILKSNLLSLSDMNIKKNVGDRWPQFQCEDSTKAIVNAMEEYADERCIALLDWLWEVCNDEETWKLIGHNNEQILEKFKQQNNKIW